MSPRLPLKISLRHDWTKELGSKIVRQPEGEVARQAKFFQPTQPTPNPITDRSGRPDEMQDERKTSRSQEISVNSFNEELSSSDRTGRPVETEEIQARSSEDSKSLNVEQTHDRTGRSVNEKKFFQGIHDRFIRDETFRNRMIENGRDEDACGQMEVLAGEDHTHHMTPQEYYHYKSNWWLRSNKTGSNTVPVERRPDFKQAFSTLQQLKLKEEGAQTNQQWAQSSSSSS